VDLEGACKCRLFTGHLKAIKLTSNMMMAAGNLSQGLVPCGQCCRCKRCDKSCTVEEALIKSKNAGFWRRETGFERGLSREGATVSMDGVVREVKTFLASDESKCFTCRKEMPKGGAQHYPNHCGALKGLWTREHCRNCFNPGHKAEDVSNIMRSNVSDAMKAASKGVLDCAWVIASSDTEKSLRPCLQCYLVHDVDMVVDPDLCRNRGHHIRGLLLSVYHHPQRRRDFINDLKGGVPGLPKAESRDNFDPADWREFFEWCVFRGRLKFNNMYHLILWCSKHPLQ